MAPNRPMLVKNAEAGGNSSTSTALPTCRRDQTLHKCINPKDPHELQQSEPPEGQSDQTKSAPTGQNAPRIVMANIANIGIASKRKANTRGQNKPQQNKMSPKDAQGQNEPPKAQALRHSFSAVGFIKELKKNKRGRSQRVKMTTNRPRRLHLQQKVKMSSKVSRTRQRQKQSCKTHLRSPCKNTTQNNNSFLFASGAQGGRLPLPPAQKTKILVPGA